jgi:hypothetical protein
VKTIQNPVLLRDEPSQHRLEKLTIRVADKTEYKKFGELLNQEHYLGDLPKGRQLLHVIELDSQVVALLDWGPASHKLIGRDEYIGWTSSQRAERLSLIAMNRRFCILAEFRMPNLASKCLALSTRNLPKDWEDHYGHPVVIAETFTDIEQFEGTCYKANNWRDCDNSKGFSKQNNQYTHHGKPKKLWIKTLNRNALRILTAIDLPKKYQSAVKQTSERDLPLKKGQMLSLRDHISKNLTDPRRYNKTFPASSLLTLVIMAIFAGRKDLSSIQRYGQFLTHKHRVALDFPKKKDAGSRKAPSYKALYNLLGQIDVNKFAEVISSWLQQNQGSLPQALAIDGKWIRNHCLSVGFSDHETGVPVVFSYSELKKK